MPASQTLASDLFGCAVRNGIAAIIEILIEYGGDVNAVADENNTPLNTITRGRRRPE